MAVHSLGFYPNIFEVLEKPKKCSNVSGVSGMIFSKKHTSKWEFPAEIFMSFW